jgi:Flp pilus assembly protein TadG
MLVRIIGRRSGPDQTLRRTARHQPGQSLVEFALILPVLMLVLMGIVQMGFVFNAYVTISNATREAARTATIYLYDRNQSVGANDTARNEAARSALDSAMGMLSSTSPGFANSSTWTITNGGDTFTTGDLVVAYTLPAGVTDADSRAGQRVSVAMTYHLDLLIPFIGAILPHDANGRLPLTAQVSMLVN